MSEPYSGPSADAVAEAVRSAVDELKKDGSNKALEQLKFKAFREAVATQLKVDKQTSKHKCFKEFVKQSFTAIIKQGDKPEPTLAPTPAPAPAPAPAVGGGVGAGSSGIADLPMP